jgi:adenylate cyclase
MSFAEAEIAQRGEEGYSIASARIAAERAIAADPSVAEGYAALAEALMRGTMVLDAEVSKALETAFRLDPDCFEAHLVAGSAGIVCREYEKAIKHFERAIELDPDAYWPAGMVSQAYEAVGDTAAALAAHRRALAHCEKILADEPDHGAALGFLVTSLASLGLADRARDWTRRALLFDPDNLRLRYNLACAMATLQDADFTVALMDPLVDTVNAGSLRWFQSDNSLDPVREHPKFVALAERMARRLAALEAPEQPAA